MLNSERAARTRALPFTLHACGTGKIARPTREAENPWPPHTSNPAPLIRPTIPVRVVIYDSLSGFSESSEMRFASAGNQESNTKKAIREAAMAVEQQLSGQTPDLAFVFVTHHHTTEPGFGRQLYAALGSRVLVGCTAESVASNGHEYENGPAIAIWAACLPGCGVDAFHIAFERTLDGLLATGAPSAEAVTSDSRAAFLLGDPFSCSVDSMLAHFGAEFPGLPVLGGMASGASAPGENRLFVNDGEYDHGSVGFRTPASHRTDQRSVA